MRVLQGRAGEAAAKRSVGRPFLGCSRGMFNRMATMATRSVAGPRATSAQVRQEADLHPRAGPPDRDADWARWKRGLDEAATPHLLKEAISKLARPTDGWLWATRSLRSPIGLWGNALMQAGGMAGFVGGARVTVVFRSVAHRPSSGLGGSRGQSWSLERHSTIPAAKL